MNWLSDIPSTRTSCPHCDKGELSISSTDRMLKCNNCGYEKEINMTPAIEKALNTLRRRFGKRKTTVTCIDYFGFENYERAMAAKALRKKIVETEESQTT